MTTYPDREHMQADKAAERRALQALAGIEAEAGRLRRRIENGTADGEDTSTLAEAALEVTRQLTILGTLRDVREWHAADMAEAGRAE